MSIESLLTKKDQMLQDIWVPVTYDKETQIDKKYW